MSRPTSRRGKSPKGAKQKPKNPKTIIKELTEQNEQITQDLETMRHLCEEQQAKIDVLTRKLVNSINAKDYNISEQTNLAALTPDVLLEMLNALVVKKQIYDVSVEARVDELERRLTQMTMDLAKMMKKTAAYENGLEDVLNCQNLEAARDRVFQLQLIAGEEYHTFTTNDPASRAKKGVVNGRITTGAVAKGDVTTTPPSTASQRQTSSLVDRPSSAARKTLDNAHKLNLVPPSKKLPGESHIKNMHRDMRLYMIKELSVEKPSGADWRMLAQRVGIEQETIQYWQSLKLEYPMGRVFAQWGENPGATVRLLHRHLMSPQLRCTLLGKRVSDFYNVD